MTKASPVLPLDLLGFERLAIDGTLKLTDVVEAMHHNIAGDQRMPGAQACSMFSDITNLVYKNVRAITGLVDGGMQTLLTPLVPVLEERRSAPKREAVLAALNGVMGDYLAATNNPLAISMSLRRKGRPLLLERKALAAAIPQPGRKLLVLVHGLCMNDRQWTRKRHNHGTALARDLGYAAVHLHYNSGLHVSDNGRAFAKLIEELVHAWPVQLDELAIIAHSMGGLVSRSAYHYGTAAGHCWPHRLGRLIFLGTPHHGAPLERILNWVDVALQLCPYSSPLVEVSRIRSAGITDMRYGNLLDEDWEGRDRFEYSEDQRRPVRLPENVQCYAIAAITGTAIFGLTEGLSGDGIVPVNSALGRHHDPGRCLSFAEPRQWIGYGMDHWDLLDRPAVYEQIVRWLA